MANFYVRKAKSLNSKMTGTPAPFKIYIIDKKFFFHSADFLVNFLIKNCSRCNCMKHRNRLISRGNNGFCHGNRNWLILFFYFIKKSRCIGFIFTKDFYFLFKAFNIILRKNRILVRKQNPLRTLGNSRINSPVLCISNSEVFFKLNLNNFFILKF